MARVLNESNLTTSALTSRRGGGKASLKIVILFRSTPYNYRSVATFSRDPSTDAPLENP